jgi:putative cell wall-binding protein
MMMVKLALASIALAGLAVLSVPPPNELKTLEFKHVVTTPLYRLEVAPTTVKHQSYEKDLMASAVFRTVFHKPVRAANNQAAKSFITSALVICGISRVVRGEQYAFNTKGDMVEHIDKSFIVDASQDESGLVKEIHDHLCGVHDTENLV